MLEALVALIVLVGAAVLGWAFVVIFGMLFTMPVAIGGATRDYWRHHHHNHMAHA